MSRTSAHGAVPGPKRDKWGAALPLLVTGLSIVLALRRLDDADTWWHLAAGRWIAQHRAVPHTDVFSFTAADHAWINLQWLFDLAIYALYQAGGAPLLIIAAAIGAGLATALLIANLRDAVGPAGAACLALPPLVIAAERFMVRPELISLLLLQIVLWLLAAARRDGGRRLWLLVPVMLAWVNLHSLFIVGLFAIACPIASDFAARLRLLPEGWRPASSKEPAARRRLLLAGAAAFFVTVLNPYLLRGALFPLQLASRIDGSEGVFQSIGEFAPPFSATSLTFGLTTYRILLVSGLALVALAGVAAARGVHQRARPVDKRFDASGLLLFAGLAYLSLLARRNMAFFAMGAAPFLGQCLVTLELSLSRRTRSVAGLVLAAIKRCVPPALIAAGWFVASNGFYRWNHGTHEFGLSVLEVNFPIRAIAFVREMGLPQRLYSDLTSGGYLAWDGPPDGKIYMDGRLEVYGSEFLESYTKALLDPRRWQAEADRLGIATALIFHRPGIHHPLITWLGKEPRWALVYLDEVAAVFVRSAGNEDLIARARDRSATLSVTIIGNLLRRDPSWQWPVGQVSALASYAATLSLVGDLESAARLYDRLLDFDLLPEQEAEVRLDLARFHAFKGEIDLAWQEIEKADAADPGNKAVDDVRSLLGPR